MVKKQLIPQKSVTYFFIKSKDVHIENGFSSITLFARLGCEIFFFTDGKKRSQVETHWVQIDDVEMEDATDKLKTLPNCLEKYEVSEKVFQHLLQLTKSCPSELYSVIPYYVKASREMFLTWQELEGSLQYC